MLRWITWLTQKIECQAVKSRAVYWLASQYYRGVIQKESALAGITENDHILCIGGGICPFSAILFHQGTGAKITVIDNNITCIPWARQIIERLGLGEHVRVFCQDGGNAELPLSEYSVVHFALQVSPMEHVFTQVERRVAHGTKLLVRKPKSRLSGLYSYLPNFAITRCIHKACNIGSTLLFVKGDRLHEEKMAVHGSAGSTSSLCPVAA